MKPRARAATGALAAATLALGMTALAAPATAADPPEVLAGGLNSPFGLVSTSTQGAIVAQSGAGEVTRISPTGAKTTVIDNALGVAGVAAGDGHVYAVMGGPPPPGEEPETRMKAQALPEGVATYPPSSVLRTGRGGKVDVIANLLSYELKHNPDGQVQFVDGVPPDALSNPFSMNLSHFGLLVADGGANDVLKVNPRTGHVSTFFAPPTVKSVKACQADDANANPGTKGCDPVPTGVDVRGNNVYVSTLGAEAPGAGRVYKLDGRTGKVLRTWTNLHAPTGVTVSRAGNIYVSQVLDSQITKIAPGNKRTFAQVTTPTGIDARHGKVWVSAGSLLGPGAGEVVSVDPSAFGPTPPPPPVVN
jgi:hypothetical protein